MQTPLRVDRGEETNVSDGRLLPVGLEPRDNHKRFHPYETIDTYERRGITVGTHVPRAPRRLPLPDTVVTADQEGPDVRKV